MLLVGLIGLVISGCGLPAPLSWLNYGRAAYDANQIIKDDATTTDVALNKMTGMDCRIFNVLENKDVCREVAKGEHNCPNVDHNSDSLCASPQ